MLTLSLLGTLFGTNTVLNGYGPYVLVGLGLSRGKSLGVVGFGGRGSG